MKMSVMYSPTTWGAPKGKQSDFNKPQISPAHNINVEMDENERKIVTEFCHYLEKSKQLFNGLRDLPQYGHKQWQSYFGRTFDVYTKLWKFQQQNRQVLDTKYGLKRWQIGEIASKIGQLYYHYYLRTSETNYLNESFAFYSAIRMRGYYSKANKEDRPDLMVKKLRYYARFIVVCLLLKKMKLVRDLVRELSKQIEDYTATYEPEDQLEWSLVLGEIRAFIEADNMVNAMEVDNTFVVLSHRLTPLNTPPFHSKILKADNMVNVMDVDNTSVVLSHRLTPLNTPPLEKPAPGYMNLQEILIVGNCHEQVKFSELTLDMFRMLQTLEREPQEEANNPTLFDQSPAPGRQPFDNTGLSKRDNPHKYLLYKPTFSQLYTFLASGFKELPPNGAMLLYLSANGSLGNSKHTDDIAYDFGGVVTNSRREADFPNKAKRPANIKEMHCLHPGDLYPFTRKPLFVIVDSDNSGAFRHWPNLFGQPLVCLLAPENVPQTLQDEQHKGSLFTLFLHSPLMGFCHICGLVDLPMAVWDKCQTQVDKVITETGRLFSRSRNIDHSIIQFIGDDFLRVLLLRFVFCFVALRLHRGFKGPTYYPSSYPEIPRDEILDQSVLHKLVLELALILETRGLFHEPGEMD